MKKVALKSVHRVLSALLIFFAPWFLADKIEAQCRDIVPMATIRSESDIPRINVTFSKDVDEVDQDDEVEIDIGELGVALIEAEGVELLGTLFIGEPCHGRPPLVKNHVLNGPDRLSVVLRPGKYVLRVRTAEAPGTFRLSVTIVTIKVD